MGMVFGRIAEELPRHSIVSKHATYQIRRYEPSIAVQCDYSRGWGNSSDGTPFGSLVGRRLEWLAHSLPPSRRAGEGDDGGTLALRAPSPP